MNELSPNARRVLELARDQDDPAPATQRRVERALSTRIALGAGAATLGFAGKSALAAKFIVPLGIATAVTGAGWYSLNAPAPPSPRAVQAPPQASRALAIGPAQPPALEQKPQASAAPVAVVAEGAARSSPKRSASASLAPAPREAAAKPPVVAAEQLASPDDSREDISRDLSREEPQTAGVSLDAGAPPSPAIAANTRARKPAADPLLAETEALRLAQRALRSGDAAEALELLNAQDQTYRAGALKEERAAARVLALCQAGAQQAARAAAERFVRQWPRSALRARVISACRAP